MTTFKPGDRVVFTENYGSMCREGDTGTVDFVGPGMRAPMVRVNVDRLIEEPPFSVYAFRLAAHVEAPLSADGEPLLVGDKVLVLADAREGDVGGGSSMVPPRLRGRVGTVIVRPSDRVAIDGNVYVEGLFDGAGEYRVEAAGLVHYSDEDFKPYTVGDEVTVNADPVWNTGTGMEKCLLGIKEGDVAKVIEVRNRDNFVVEFGETRWDRQIIHVGSLTPYVAPVSDSRKVGDTVVIVADEAGHGRALGTVVEIVECDAYDDVLPWRTAYPGTVDGYTAWVRPTDVATVILPAPKPTASKAGTLTVEIKPDTSAFVETLRNLIDAAERVNG